MKKKYWETIQLLFTDTDSLMNEVCTDDFYQDMWARNGEFDLASYAKSSPFYDPINNRVVGKFKDEASWQSITEFVGLKPKMYSYQTLKTGGGIHTLQDPSHGEEGFTTKKRAKAIQRAAVAKLRLDQFKAQLDHPEETYVLNRRIGSKFHQLYGIEVWP